MQTEQEVQA